MLFSIWKFSVCLCAYFLYVTTVHFLIIFHFCDFSVLFWFLSHFAVIKNTFFWVFHEMSGFGGFWKHEKHGFWPDLDRFDHIFGPPFGGVLSSSPERTMQLWVRRCPKVVQKWPKNDLFWVTFRTTFGGSCPDPGVPHYHYCQKGGQEMGPKWHFGPLLGYPCFGGQKVGRILVLDIRAWECILGVFGGIWK